MAAPISPGAYQPRVPNEPPRVVSAEPNLDDDFSSGDRIWIDFWLDRNLSPLERRVLDERSPQNFVASDLEPIISLGLNQLKENARERLQLLLDDLHSQAVARERDAQQIRDELTRIISSWDL